MGNCEGTPQNRTLNDPPIYPKNFLNTNRGIPNMLFKKVKKTICKIIIKNIFNGTGFFMNIPGSQKFLITNNHIISENKINENIEIEIYNKKKMALNFNNRQIKFFPKPKDITIIEIKNSDEIYNDISFLVYDGYYTKNYKCYKDAEIFSLYFSKEGEILFGSGKIILTADFEFDYIIQKDKDCDGGPILLFNDNINSIRVMGIYKESEPSHNLITGTFIGEIFNNEINGLNRSSNHISMKTTNNEKYIPYSCITGLEQNDLSFPSQLTQE